MNRTDRAAWRSARTLADLCELTARWIEGDLRGQPSYGLPSDVDYPEVTVPVLAALNRAGYLTFQSQAGESDEAEDLEQCAAVEGFADAATAIRITDIALTGGMRVVVHEPPTRWSWRVRHDQSVTAQWIDGRPGTSFGTRFPQHLLRDGHVGYGICHRDAVNAVCSAWQVAVIDPVPGRRDRLWAVLSVFAGSTRPCCGCPK